MSTKVPERQILSPKHVLALLERARSAGNWVTMIQRRRFYRLQYPTPERPVLLVGDAQFTVLDLSESGARVEKSREWQRDMFPDNGTVLFSEGEEFCGMIHVVRESEHCIAVSFSPQVPFSRIMSEQRKLWRKYPLKG